MRFLNGKFLHPVRGIKSWTEQIKASVQKDNLGRGDLCTRSSSGGMWEFFFDLGRSLGRGWGEGGPADGEGGTSSATRKPPGVSRWCVGRPPGVLGGEAVGGPGSHRRGEQRGNCLGRSGREGKVVGMGTE